MGGLIFVALIFLGLLIFVMRALRTRVTPDPGNTEPTAHEAVISRLEDHRRRRGQAGDEGADKEA
jgi:hypothetical protein